METVYIEPQLYANDENDYKKAKNLISDFFQNNQDQINIRELIDTQAINIIKKIKIFAEYYDIQFVAHCLKRDIHLNINYVEE